MSAEEWPSGVGGVWCDGCGRATICRHFGDEDAGDDTEWLCRPCFLGADAEVTE